jgi:hypothetical protein
MTIAKSLTHDLDSIRAIVFREGDFYVAQCLELDISTQARDLDAVLERLDLTIEAECAMCIERGQKPFEGICAAPNYYHELWEKRTVKLARVHVPIDKHFPRVEAALAKAA